MLAIPERVLSAFEAGLRDFHVPVPQQSAYKKWLRFYWDFCKKYQFAVGQRTSLPAFLQKLRSKKQSEEACLQAQAAIELFYGLCEQRRQDTSTSSVTDTSIPAVNHRVVLDGMDSEALSFPVSSLRQAQYIDSAGSEYDSGSGKAAEPIPSLVAFQNAHANQVAELVTEYKTQGASWVGVYAGLKAEIKLRHYSPRTLSSYQSWMRQFQAFVKSKAPALLSQQDVKDFLTHLAVEKQVAASTQNQAFNALLFLFKQVLKVEFGEIRDVPRAKRRPYVPVVLSRSEIDLVLARLRPPYLLPTQLLYGCGLRISECLGLRLQDFNLDLGRLTVHRGKGGKDRTVPLPQSIMGEIEQQFERVKVLHDEDLAAGYAGVFLPDSLDEKYKNAATELAWQWFFPAKTLTFVADEQAYRRYHLHDTQLQKAIRSAVKRAKLTKRVTAHTFRHSFASHLLQGNYDIRTVQALMGHADVRTTMIYLQTIPSVTLEKAKSPLDFSVPNHAD